MSSSKTLSILQISPKSTTALALAIVKDTLNHILIVLALLSLDLVTPLRLATVHRLEKLLVVRISPLALLLRLLRSALRRALALLGRRRLTDSTGRGGRSSSSAGELLALDGVPARAEAGAVLVAELGGDFLDVKLGC